MFGKEAVKLITELDTHEDIRPFNVSVMNAVILYYYSISYNNCKVFKLNFRIK